MAKPFASSADTMEKTDTLEVLGEGAYALAAEGDPNVGAVEGEDFVVAIEGRATPSASRAWRKIPREETDKPVRFLILTHTTRFAGSAPRPSTRATSSCRQPRATWSPSAGARTGRASSAGCRTRHW